MGFRLVPTSMTLDDLERRNSPYFGGGGWWRQSHLANSAQTATQQARRRPWRRQVQGASLDILPVIQLKYRVMYMYRRLGRTCTLQQIRRHINDSSCSSSTSPKFKLQLCRCYNWSLLETLTVHGWTSRCLPVRFVFCFILYNRFILELYTRISIWFKF